MTHVLCSLRLHSWGEWDGAGDSQNPCLFQRRCRRPPCPATQQRELHDWQARLASQGDFHGLFQALSHSDPQIRHRAETALLPILHESLDAIRQLGDEAGIEAVPLLVRVCSHRDASARSQCAYRALLALGKRLGRAEPLIECLQIEILQDEEFFAICVAAAKLLGKIRDKSAIDPLLVLLNKDFEGRIHQLARQSAEAEERRSFEEWAYRNESHFRNPPVLDRVEPDPCVMAAAECLMRLRADSLYREAAQALGAIIGFEAAASAIWESYQRSENQRETRRRDALFLVLEVCEQGASSALLEIVRNGSVPEKMGAVPLLGKLRDPAVLPILQEELTGTDYELSQAAVAAMAEIGSAAVDTLVPFLASPLWALRKRTIVALKRIDDERARSALRAAKKTERDFELREMMEEE